MEQAIHYTKVDLSTWKRAEYFQHFISELRMVMSLTVEVNVASLLAYVQKHGLKFYPCMLWVVSRVLNAHEEFKYGWNEEGQLIRWDFLSPSYADFHKEDESFVKLCTTYDEDLFVFHARFLADREAHRADHAFLQQPPNVFDASCMPWVRYQHFALHVFDEGKFLGPVVLWGKYEAENGKIVMPLTLNIHHAVADGFHMSRFFAEVQALMDSLQ